jgi:EPS-associated MarR family transcriptional regulator
VNAVPPHVPESLALDTIRLLEERPALSQRELAKSLSVSVGRAQHHIRALVAKGIVKLRNCRKDQNKSAYLYIPTPKGVRAKGQLAREYLQIKVRDYDALRAEITRPQRDSEEIGRER